MLLYQRSLLFSFLCLICTSVAIAAPQKTKNNWHNKIYVRGDIGYAMPANKFKNRSRVDTYLTKRLNKTVTYNLGVGYIINDTWRGDLIFGYKKFKYRATETGFAANSQEIKSYTGLFNVYFEPLRIKETFTPYIVGGVGGGINDSSNLLSKNLVTNQIDSFSGSKHKNLIWSVGVGIRFILDNRFNLDISYKYTDLGKVKTKEIPNITNDIPSTQKIKSHEILGGVIIFL